MVIVGLVALGEFGGAGGLGFGFGAAALEEAPAPSSETVGSLSSGSPFFVLGACDGIHEDLADCGQQLEPLLLLPLHFHGVLEELVRVKISCLCAHDLGSWCSRRNAHQCPKVECRMVFNEIPEDLCSLYRRCIHRSSSFGKPDSPLPCGLSPEFAGGLNSCPAHVRLRVHLGWCPVHV